MSCMLRASGQYFDVDSFVEDVPLTVHSLWRKGEKCFPDSFSNDKLKESSGIRIVASEADFSELSQQIKDAISFIQHNQESIKCLCSYPGVESAVLDFGAEIYPPGWASFTFPPELLSLSGLAGVSLCLSVYPTENERDTDI